MPTAPPFNKPVVAVLDIGSNSIKILVATTGSPIQVLYSSTRDTRISSGLGADDPRLTPESIEAGIASSVTLLEQAARFQPQKIQIVATSAVRDAANQNEFRERFEAATGLPLEILSGEAEAQGIAFGIMTDPNIHRYPGFIAIDLGGGSLECIRCTGKIVEDALSFPLGAVRLSERFVRDTHAPYSAEVLQTIAQYVRNTLLTSGFRFDPLPGPIVGTSGACSVSRSILAHRMGRPFSQAPNELSIFYLKALLQEVANMDHAKRAQIPQLPATRADIFPTSLVTLITLLELTGSTSILHCPRNLRFGLAAKLLADLS